MQTLTTIGGRRLTPGEAGGYTHPLGMSAPIPPRRFIVVSARPRTRLLLAAAAVLWLASVAAAWTWATQVAAPTLAEVREENRVLAGQVAEQRRQLDELRQRSTTYRRSDEISRAANQELQQTLAEREEEIAQLRADVAFYERLVGASGQRRGLGVHSVRMEPGAEGAWLYTVTLTQNLNRGKISRGELTLQVDGVRDGKLASLRWPELLQREDAPAQEFAFRYFQQLEGSLMLPPGFAPNRVRVLLRAEGNTTEQAFPWEATQQAVATAGR